MSITKTSNKDQIEFLKFIEKNIPKNKKILYFWGGIGGYVFRPHLSYFWYMDGNLEKVADLAEKRDIYYQNFNKSEDMPVIILEDVEKSKIPSNILYKIKSEYHKHPKLPIYVHKQDSELINLVSSQAS